MKSTAGTVRPTALVPSGYQEGSSQDDIILNAPNGSKEKTFCDKATCSLTCSLLVQCLVKDAVGIWGDLFTMQALYTLLSAHYPGHNS